MIRRMFSCKESIQLLVDYLDGDMTPEERQHLDEHLAGCPPCVEFVRAYRATSGMCKKALAAQRGIWESFVAAINCVTRPENA